MRPRRLLQNGARLAWAEPVTLSSGTADAHFWLGVGLGRWAETKGMMKALFALKTIKKEMAETLKLDPQHGGRQVRVFGHEKTSFVERR